MSFSIREVEALWGLGKCTVTGFSWIIAEFLSAIHVSSLLSATTRLPRASRPSPLPQGMTSIATCGCSSSLRVSAESIPNSSIKYEKISKSFQLSMNDCYISFCAAMHPVCLVTYLGCARQDVPARILRPTLRHTAIEQTLLSNTKYAEDQMRKANPVSYLSSSLSTPR